MTSFRTLDDIGEIEGKRVLVRVDLNVPMQEGKVSDDTRLRATLPTVTELAEANEQVLPSIVVRDSHGDRSPQQLWRF